MKPVLAVLRRVQLQPIIGIPAPRGTGCACFFEPFRAFEDTIQVAAPARCDWIIRWRQEIVELLPRVNYQ